MDWKQPSLSRRRSLSAFKTAFWSAKATSSALPLAASSSPTKSSNDSSPPRSRVYNSAVRKFAHRRCHMGLYSHYDGAHNHPVNRALHMIAIPVGFSSLVVVWYHWIIALLLIPA